MVDQLFLSRRLATKAKSKGFIGPCFARYKSSNNGNELDWTSSRGKGSQLGLNYLNEEPFLF